MRRKQTPSQTAGPFFACGLTSEQYGYPFRSLAGPVLAQPGAAGDQISIVGRVLDGAGQSVGDAMIEIWQADAQGRFQPDGTGSFSGFGRAGTGPDPERRFRFETVKPGAPGDGQAPHVSLVVFMRGLLSHAFTRLYFSDEAAANATDPVLASVPAERRETLIATREESTQGVVYRFDIHMQGECETVFFDA